MKGQRFGNTNFLEVQCQQCYSIWLVTARLNPGHSAYEDIYCKLCRAYIREIRADLSYTMAALALVKQLDEQNWLNMTKGQDGHLCIQLLRGPNGEDLVDEFYCEPPDLDQKLLSKGISSMVSDELVKQAPVL